MQNLKQNVFSPPMLYLIRNERITPPPRLVAGENVLLFDSESGFCQCLARFVIRADPQKKIHLAAFQSPAGQDLLRWAGPCVGQANHIVYIACGLVSIKADAWYALLEQLGWPWRALLALFYAPESLRRAASHAIDRNRWLGRHSVGATPPDDRPGRRYIDGGQR